jgi:hypothetical protein
LEKVQHKWGHNTIPIRQSGVKIVNLGCGCPVLEAFQGRGFLVGFASIRFIDESQEKKVKSPTLPKDGRVGHPKFNAKAGPPGLPDSEAMQLADSGGG